MNDRDVATRFVTPSVLERWIAELEALRTTREALLESRMVGTEDSLPAAQWHA
jgi:hypothetical protein